MRKHQSCVIIGGGIGGLFAGAFLAKGGLKVTVLEKNSIIGGGLQCFSRNGKLFETGMHVAGGFLPGGSLFRICRYLGILDRLNIHHIPPECMDEIFYNSTGETFRIASGREGFADSIASYFPEEAPGIRAYVDELFRLTDRIPLFSLRKGLADPVGNLSADYIAPADQLIERYVSDPRLREILAYMNPLYGGVKGHTPTYIHALLSVLYINGASRFAGGGQQLADALRDVITDNGGMVASNAEVASIDAPGKCVRKVTTTDGRDFEADCFISAIHPASMARMLPPSTFRPAFISRLEEIPNTTSAFSLYIDLKPDIVPFFHQTRYYMEDFGMMWQQERQSSENWPNAFMFMTPPDVCQGRFASRLLVHCLMDFKTVKKWENTVRSHRGEEYEEWKKGRAALIVSKLRRVIPEIDRAINHIYSSSPLSIRDYYATKEGSIFGYRKDSGNFLFSRLSVNTKVENLFLTGQNIILHGICGTPLTAIKTAEAILGENTVIDAINSLDSNEN